MGIFIFFLTFLFKYYYDLVCCVSLFYFKKMERIAHKNYNKGWYRETNVPNILLMNTITFQSECGFLFLLLSEKMRKLNESLEVILFHT